MPDPPITMNRSSLVSRLRAAVTPANIAIGTVMTNASRASLAERSRGPWSTSVTSRSLLKDFPRSKWTSPFMYRPYCVSTESLRPHFSLNRSTASGVAVFPRTLLATLCGSTLTVRKTMVTRSHSVMIASKRRFRM